MVDHIAIRRPVLNGRSVSRSWASVTPAAPASRVVLRAPANSVAAVSKGLGFALPTSVRTSASKGTRTALCLGPDEWLVFDADGTDLPAAFAKVKAFHAAVEVSHRNVGIIVKGRGAQATLSAGCPQDLSLAEFPVGTCCRTIMGKAEVVLLRTGEDEFRVECWRSFADYVFTFLTEASRDPLI